MTACVGALTLIAGLDNILDYGANFAAVQHILSMDAIGPNSPFAWRAITSAPLHHLAYVGIIAAELGSSALCFAGAGKLFRARRCSLQSFTRAKDIAIAGLVVALGLYFFGFLVVGGEWFQMWRSQVWNMQQAAFRFIGSVGVILLFVAQPDADCKDSGKTVAEL